MSDQYANAFLEANGTNIKDVRRPAYVVPYKGTAPRMSPSDVAMYKEAAYGTRHEPWITTPGYANAFAYSLRSPLASYGADFSRFSVYQNGSDSAQKLFNRNLNGEYTPSNDRGEAVDDPHGFSPGAVLAHELWHRGRKKIIADVIDDKSNKRRMRDVPPVAGPDFEHELMDWENRKLRGTGTPIVGTLPKVQSDPDTLSWYEQRFSDLVQMMRAKRGDFGRMGPR